MNLEILFEDECLVAINKPSGLLVHRTSLAANESRFALQMVRDLTGLHVFPVHRLDRPTSGVLLFAKSSEVAAQLKAQFDSRKVKKVYWAVCRGYCPEEGQINEPLLNEEKGTLQEAETHYKRLKTVELPIHVSRYPTSRYSLVEVQPITGRMHQIRKHFAKIRHYLIGDTKYGDLPHNRMFKEKWGCDKLLLHAKELSVIDPMSNKGLILKASLPGHFKSILRDLPWSKLPL